MRLEPTDEKVPDLRAGGVRNEPTGIDTRRVKGIAAFITRSASVRFGQSQVARLI